MTSQTKSGKHTCRSIECWRTHYGLCLRRRRTGGDRRCSQPLHHEGDHVYAIRLSPKIDLSSPTFWVPALAAPAIVLLLKCLAGAGS